MLKVDKDRDYHIGSKPYNFVKFYLRNLFAPQQVFPFPVYLVRRIFHTRSWVMGWLYYLSRRNPAIFP
jgi:hypothetical protein